MNSQISIQYSNIIQFLFSVYFWLTRTSETLLVHPIQLMPGIQKPEKKNNKRKDQSITQGKFKNILRSSHRRCSVRKAFLWNFAKITGKHLCKSLFFNKVVGLSLQLYKKKRLWHRCFPVNFTKFLRTPFLRNSSGWLLLYFFLQTRKHS